MRHRDEQIAKILGFLLPISGTVAVFALHQGYYFIMILVLVTWCLFTGLWAVYSGCLFFVGSKKAPMGYLYGKTARFLGFILLLIPLYYLVLVLTR